MAFTVGDLLRSAHLRLELLAGASGLDASVEWAHSCDLPDPWNWVGEHQVLLSNGFSIPRSASGQVNMLDRLARAGACAWGIGAEMGAPPLHKETLAHADALGLVLFSVPYPLPFIAVSQTIAEANSSAQARRTQATAQLYALAAPEDPDVPRTHLELCMAIADITGFDATIVDTSCRHSWGADLSSPAWLADTRPLSRRGREGVAALWENHSGDLLHVLAIRTVPDCAAVFHARPGDFHDPALLLHAASVIGSHLSQRHLEAVQRNRRRVEYVDRILQERDRLTGASSAWLRELGCTTYARGIVLSGGSSAQQDAVVHRLQRHGCDLAASMRSGKMFAIVPGDDDPSALLTLLKHCTSDPVHIGVGSLLPASDIRTSLTEAVWALHLNPPPRAGDVPCDHHLVSTYDGDAEFYGFGHPDHAEPFIRDALGPLLGGTDSHRALFDTLSAYLDENRSPQRVAQQLVLHRQTVNQRLRKIEQLLDVDLRSTEAIARLWVALSLLRATGRRELG